MRHKSKPPSIWRPIVLATATILGASGGAFISTGLHTIPKSIGQAGQPMNWTFIIVGFVMAAVGAIFGAGGLLWGLSDRWRWFVSERAWLKYHKRMVSALEQRCERALLDQRALDLMLELSQEPADQELKDLFVRSIVNAERVDDHTGRTAVKLFCDLLRSESSLDALPACVAVHRMMLKECKECYKLRIEELMQFIDFAVSNTLRRSLLLSSKSYNACKLLIDKHADLPRREELRFHLNGLRDLAIADQAARFSDGGL